MSTDIYAHKIILHHGTEPNSKPKFREGRIAMHVTDRLFFVSRADGTLEEIPFDQVPSSLCEALVEGWFLFGKPEPRPSRNPSIMGAILEKLGLA